MRSRTSLCPLPASACSRPSNVSISPTPIPLMQGFLRGQDPNSFQLPLSYLGFHQKCPDPNCRVKKSLHGHHPRDCLFYLRDWSAVRLQKLLQVRWPTWLVCQLPRRGGRV